MDCRTMGVIGVVNAIRRRKIVVVTASVPMNSTKR